MAMISACWLSCNSPCLDQGLLDGDDLGLLLLHPGEGGHVCGLSGWDSHPGKLGIQGSCVNIQTWDYWGVGNGGKIVLVLDSLLSCQDSSPTRNLGEGNEGGERKEGEHLSRTEELVFSKNVEPH